MKFFRSTIIRPIQRITAVHKKRKVGIHRDTLKWKLTCFICFLYMSLGFELSVFHLLSWLSIIWATLRDLKITYFRCWNISVHTTKKPSTNHCPYKSYFLTFLLAYYKERASFWCFHPYIYCIPIWFMLSIIFPLPPFPFLKWLSIFHIYTFV